MEFCVYKAVDIDGRKLKGKCWCASRDSLVKALRDKGYYLVDYKELNNKKYDYFSRKLPVKDLSILCHQFASLAAAGVNIFEVINIIQQGTGNKLLRKTLSEIEHMIRQGVGLSSCMAAYARTFPKFMVSMVGIGEESGTLEQVFQKLSEYYAHENQLRNKVIKALSYPCAIFLVSIVVIQILFLYIIPVFLSTIQEVGGKVPEVTKIVLSISYFLKYNFSAIMLFIVMLILTAVFINKIYNVRLLIDKFILTSGLTKAIVQKNIAVKFSRSLGIMLNSGIPIIKALDFSKNILDNQYACLQINKCVENIKRGSAFSKGISSTNIFPIVLCSMARIGEEGGFMSDMLIKASNILEEDLYEAVDRLTSLIEPTLIIFLSFFVGSILISLIMPMFNIMDSI